MLCGFFVGLLTSVIPVIRIDDYGLRLAAITGVSCVVWLVVMLATPPESDDVLERFVRTVRPPGPGWALLREKFDVKPMESLTWMAQRFVLANVVLFGGLISIGGFLLHQQFGGWSGLIAFVVAALLLRRGASSEPRSAE